MSKEKEPLRRVSRDLGNIGVRVDVYRGDRVIGFERVGRAPEYLPGEEPIDG